MAAFFTRKPDCGETKSIPSSRGPRFLPTKVRGLAPAPRPARPTCQSRPRGEDAPGAHPPDSPGPGPRPTPARRAALGVPGQTKQPGPAVPPRTGGRKRGAPGGPPHGGQAQGSGSGPEVLAASPRPPAGSPHKMEPAGTPPRAGPDGAPAPPPRPRARSSAAAASRGRPGPRPAAPRPRAQRAAQRPRARSSAGPAAGQASQAPARPRLRPGREGGQEGGECPRPRRRWRRGRRREETDISFELKWSRFRSDHWPKRDTNLQCSPGWLPSPIGCLVGQKMAAKEPVPARSSASRTRPSLPPPRAASLGATPSLRASRVPARRGPAPAPAPPPAPPRAPSGCSCASLQSGLGAAAVRCCG